ncbi:SagB/ThcOx family dehydrogenase [Halorussus caseinilyticus]|uniref:SagB/ThcOx family dehydrogenase n=2 Tax=Halorussus caseinilyticus TaxID=3034025 RepID=A0ABD5WKX2_9EURY
MSQEYEPSSFEFVSSYFEQFMEKEFGDGGLAELFHENTKYTDQESLELGESAAMFSNDPSMEYAQAKLKPDYRGKERLDLPDPDELDARIDDVLASRRSQRDQSGEGLSLQELSTLLDHSCGTTGSQRIEPDEDDPFSDVEKPFRAYASGGALYPSEIYLAVVNEGENLDRGLYYYVPEDHALRVLRKPDEDEDFAQSVDDLFATPQDVFDHQSCAVKFLITGAFWRSKAKYGPRGYRFVLQETGHLGQNVLLVAEAMGLAAVPLASFYDDKVNEFLDIDGVDEAVTYTLSIGKSESGDTHE